MVSEYHPGPTAASLPAELLQAMIDLARTEYPNEACGLILADSGAADGGRALRFEPARNAAASPYRYEIHPDDLYRLAVAADDADQVFWGIVHSHTHTPAVPSTTDRRQARYPGAFYLLASLSDPDATPAQALRAWRIADGESRDVPLHIG